MKIEQYLFINTTDWTLDKPNPFRFEKAAIPDEPERISERLKPPFSDETGV